MPAEWAIGIVVTIRKERVTSGTAVDTEPRNFLTMKVEERCLKKSP